MTWPTWGNLMWFGAGVATMLFIAAWLGAPPRVTEKEERDEMRRQAKLAHGLTVTNTGKPDVWTEFKDFEPEEE